jgi:3-keto-disaccharide hydrolase
MILTLKDCSRRFSMADKRIAFLIVAMLVLCVISVHPDKFRATASYRARTGIRNEAASASPHFVQLFNGKTLNGWIQVPAHSWTVKHGAMTSTGAGRGFIYTSRTYRSYRLIFTARHVSGIPGHDHQMCFLIFCTRPEAGQEPLDALGGIQFQPPNGGHWDYRPGHNNVGEGEFTRLPHKEFDPHRWFRVEVLVDESKGTARMAVAQPVSSETLGYSYPWGSAVDTMGLVRPVEGKAVEVLDFKVPAAGRKGPIAFQMHNKGLIDEYENVFIEVNPAQHHLFTTK